MGGATSFPPLAGGGGGKGGGKKMGGGFNTPPSPTLSRRRGRGADRARGRARSHRLERAIELDVDEHGLAVLECLSNEVGGLMHGLGPLGRDAKRARQRNEVYLGIDE